MRRACWLAALVLVAAPAGARDLKVATWNLDWLTFRHAGDPMLPADVQARTPGDFDVLAHYASRLDADVVALEEVDGAAPAARLFPPDRYQVLIADDAVVQRVGLAVRLGIDVTRHPDLTALDVQPGARHRLRSGLDVTLRVDGQQVRVLAVHLKSGCWSAREDSEGRPACDDLDRQVPVLAAWVAARRAEGVPFLILGDFNRRLVAGDRVLAALDAAAPLASATWGLSSPCGGGEDFIDQILAGDAASGWMLPDSLRVLTYRDPGMTQTDRISDHCPVSIRLEVPPLRSAGTGTGDDR